MTDKTNSAASGRRVLIVEDNVDSADTMQILLQLSGYEARAAYDGTSALSIAREFEPHAVLLDIGLPDISGHEVARTARAEGWLSQDALLIALTGWGDDRSKSDSAEAGIDVHLIKPVDFTLLLDLIRERVPPAPAM